MQITSTKRTSWIDWTAVFETEPTQADLASYKKKILDYVNNYLDKASGMKTKNPVISSKAFSANGYKPKSTVSAREMHIWDPTTNEWHGLGTSDLKKLLDDKKTQTKLGLTSGDLGEIQEFLQGKSLKNWKLVLIPKWETVSVDPYVLRFTAYFDERIGVVWTDVKSTTTPPQPPPPPGK